MIPLLDVLDEDGNMTGQKTTIDDVHSKGLWHRAAHVWVINSMGQILIQKRSEHVVNHPMMLDISTAGHVDAGETAFDAAKREMNEELGILVDDRDLVYLTTIVNKDNDSIPNRLNFEFDEIFVVRKDYGISEMVLDTHEISEVFYSDLSEFKESVFSRDERFVPHWDEYELIIRYLESN